MNKFHYFANHALAGATADTEELAIERLLLLNTDPSWNRNCLKDGAFLTVFVCRVPLAENAPYAIEWYKPVVEGLTECKNMLVTYLTKTKYAVARDPNDEIAQLKHDVKEREQALFNLSYAIVTGKSFHDPDVLSSIAEAKPLITALQDAHNEKAAAA